MPARLTSPLRFLGLGLVAATLLLASCLASACQGHTEAQPCTAGETQACTCAGGVSGLQSCDTSGGYGACVCGADAADDAHQGLPFMAACFEAGTPGDCDPDACAPNCSINGYPHLDYCYDYRSRGLYCTHACTTSSQCPPPSGGCNAMGICRAPGATGAGDGGGGGHG